MDSFQAEKPLIGYRAWRWNGMGQLDALSIGKTAWKRGENIATCSPFLTDKSCYKSPGPFCHCGFNAWKNLDILEAAQKGTFSRLAIPDTENTVLGAILAAGDLRIHTEGFRAEKAQVLALFWDREESEPIMEHVVDYVGNRTNSFLLDESLAERNTRDVARHFDVPFFDNRREFLEFVSTYGRSLDELAEHSSGGLTEDEYRTSWHGIAKPLDAINKCSYEDDWGTQFWYRNGLLHREDGPAIAYANGDQEWYREGLRHREGGPAVVGLIGDGDGAARIWYQNGHLYREDGYPIEGHWVQGFPLDTESDRGLLEEALNAELGSVHQIRMMEQRQQGRFFKR